MAAFLDVTAEVEVRRSLENALDQLREEDQRKDQFLAMLGHELRNPVASVDAAVQLLEERGAEALPRTGPRLRGNLRHLRRLLDDLLDVSRISRGKIALQREPTDLNAVVKRAVAGGEDAIEGREQKLTIRLPADPAWIDGDPTRLEQVVLNLLGNASRYTRDGGRITIGLDAGDRARGTEHVLRIDDSGEGIPSEMLETIFEPFVQGNRQGATRGGLGLGLTLVRQLVELHGGSVRATSSGPGEGSRFEVRLPAAEAPEERTETAAPADAIRKGLDVLVVDDNRDAAEGLGDLLDLRGAGVRIALDPEQALAAFREATPEVMLLDLDLPGMSGYELVDALREDGLLGDCVVVVITGFGHQEARRRSEAAGIEHHLIKPVDLGALMDLLAAV